jgi:LPXTG-motif cell wall-anchored protein
MPGEQIRQQAIAVAVDEHRKARMERFRAERSGMAAYSRIGMSSTSMVIFVGGSFLLPIGGGAVAFSISMARGQEPYSPAIFILWAGVVALIGGIAGFVMYRKRRKQRITDELSQLVTRHAGELLGGVEGTAIWLNRYWAGPFDISQLTRGPYNDSAHLMVEGYPVLVDLDLVAASQHHRARGLMLLACEVPGMGDPTEATLQISPDIRGLMKQAADLGFDVDFRQAGLIARANEATVRALLKKPGSIVSLSQVASSMVRLARAYGGSPVPPIP